MSPFDYQVSNQSYDTFRAKNNIITIKLNKSAPDISGAIHLFDAMRVKTKKCIETNHVIKGGGLVSDMASV